MENQFLCLKDETGTLRPMAFLFRDNEAGKYSVQNYQNKLQEGETIVKVEIKEIK